MNDETKSCSTPSNAEPTASRSTLPMWIFAFTFVLLFLGFVYFDFHAGWFDARVYKPYVSADQLELYQPKSGEAGIARSRQADLRHGVRHLPRCGRPWQAGDRRRLWPVPNGSRPRESIASRPSRSPVLPGRCGSKARNGISRWRAMGAGLSDSDLAAVLTYIRGSWGNKAEAVTADDVKSRPGLAG
ncbi:MAG: hypothetical protein WDM76_14520 [Limisphaerales bacterium]